MLLFLAYRTPSNTIIDDYSNPSIPGVRHRSSGSVNTLTRIAALCNRAEFKPGQGGIPVFRWEMFTRTFLLLVASEPSCFWEWNSFIHESFFLHNAAMRNPPRYPGVGLLHKCLWGSVSTSDASAPVTRPRSPFSSTPRSPSVTSSRTESGIRRSSRFLSTRPISIRYGIIEGIEQQPVSYCIDCSFDTCADPPFESVWGGSKPFARWSSFGCASRSFQIFEIVGCAVVCPQWPS